MGKLFLTGLTNRFVKYCEDTNLYSDFQNAFRKNRLTVESLLALVFVRQLTKYRRNHGRRVYGGLIDIKKACPSINRETLLEKMAASGFSKKFVDLIVSMFNKDTYSVLTNGEILQVEKFTSGSSEGSSPSPGFFILVFDEVVRALGLDPDDPVILGVRCGIEAYADDLVALSTHYRQAVFSVHLLISSRHFLRRWASKSMLIKPRLSSSTHVTRR